MASIPVHTVHWKRAWRIIPTLYPEEHLYAPIANKGDWASIIEIERGTNSGVQQEMGDTRHLRSEDHLPKGKSAYNIGRPFAFPTQSRFSDGHFGIFYAAKELITAVKERTFHTARFLSQTSENPGPIEQRVLTAEIHASMHDLRGQPHRWKDVYRPNDYSASQKLGRTLWDKNSHGIVYDSVRHKDGECIAVFSPQAISHCRQDRCLQFDWDGKQIRKVYEIREFIR